MKFKIISLLSVSTFCCASSPNALPDALRNKEIKLPNAAIIADILNDNDAEYAQSVSKQCPDFTDRKNNKTIADAIVGRLAYKWDIAHYLHVKTAGPGAALDSIHPDCHKKADAIFNAACIAKST